MSNCVNALSGNQNISDSLYRFVFIRVDIFCLNQQQQIIRRLEITSHLSAVNYSKQRFSMIYDVQ